MPFYAQTTEQIVTDRRRGSKHHQLAGKVAFSLLVLVAAGCANRRAPMAAAVPSATRGGGTANRTIAPGLPADRLAREVRHELIMLPYYGVFDSLSFRVDDGAVTLLGQVTRPTLKSDAERVVKQIEGVEHVDNRIVVLPLSPSDDGIRRALYRAIFSHPGLDRYSLMAVPSIHIIVANGNVTLEGSVSNDNDRNLANIAANGVSGVFSVVNNLVVEKS